MRMAVIQMVSDNRVDANLKRADALLAEAAARGAAMALLPEYFCWIGSDPAERAALREQPGSGPIQDFLADSARRHRLWLAGGSLPLAGPDPQRDFNTTLVFDPEGRQQARYDKIHLFAFQRGEERYRESDAIAAGSQPVAFDALGLHIGLSICYDLRFPELYRGLGAQRACDLFLVPAAFTHTTGSQHWEVLLRARAIENLAYVAASAQGGTHPGGRRTWGHSMIVDPWGQVLDSLAEGEGVVCAEIDPQQLLERRASLPALEHRRLG